MGWSCSWTASAHLEQLGRLARRGVKTVFHNTLAASEDGLIDEQMLTPRPNTGRGAVERLDVSTVLDAATSASDLHLDAMPSRSIPAGSRCLAIKTNSTTPGSIDLPVPADRYTSSRRNWKIARSD